jgi:hypothetical protein
MNTGGHPDSPTKRLAALAESIIELIDDVAEIEIAGAAEYKRERKQLRQRVGKLTERLSLLESRHAASQSLLNAMRPSQDLSGGGAE